MIHLSFDSEHKPHAKIVPRFECCGNGSYFTEAEVKELRHQLEIARGYIKALSDELIKLRGEK